MEALSAALAEERVTSEALVEVYFSRIEKLDTKLHGFVSVYPEQAMKEARASDAARVAGRAAGPLHGIPIAIKDIFDYAGHPTEAGSLALTDRKPAISATAVQRLEAAGMIVLGKTQMVEFAFGGWGTNPVKGTPWNPWDLETHRVPGGSSSGSAVAVAAGLAPAALGTDTGGSVRTPACWNGIVGMKTSSGLIGRGGVVPLCPTHDSVGPLTRSVRDAAVLLEVLAGFDPRDPATAEAPQIAPLAAIERDIDGFRLGVLGEDDLTSMEPAVRLLFDKALKDFEGLGARVEEIRLPLSIEEYLAGGGDIMSVESYKHLGHYAEPTNSPVDPVIRARILRGREISAPTYMELLETRRAAQADFLKRLDRLDALIVPGCHQVSIPVDQVDEDMPPNVFGRFVNFLDLASLSLPIGLTDAGLPAGMQVVVRRFDDPLALRIGRAFEKARGGLVQRPPEP
ncbi:amidase [Pelagibius litoralis]|uniref:Amidase n=1 Tax=Pelagibius litoralis TaxID=374515 RepID=A0A967EXR9_9PROT|nr:amidase [Pelagibius litoralis]NIA69378.1 amidase [Pelagibius litoralis]